MSISVSPVVHAPVGAPALVSTLEPLVPFVPGVPAGPTGPVAPCVPCTPGAPCGPAGPASPLGPVTLQLTRVENAPSVLQLSPLSCVIVELSIAPVEVFSQA